ncbi:hypothetical protein EJB05_35190, partial [Eragrostis curvula]
KPCGTHTPGTGALFFLIFRFPSELACAPRSTQLSSSTPLPTEDGNASPIVSSSFSLSRVALLLSPSFANTRSTPPWPLSTEHRRAAATAHLCSSSSHPRVHLNLLYLLEEQEHQADHYNESNSRITPASSLTNHLGFTVKFALHTSAVRRRTSSSRHRPPPAIFRLANTCLLPFGSARAVPIPRPVPPLWPSSRR